MTVREFMPSEAVVAAIRADVERYEGERVKAWGAVQWRVPMRLKPEHAHRAEMLQAIAHGAEGTCYFQWRKGRGGMEKHHGAVVDHVGNENTRVFRSVATLFTFTLSRVMSGSYRSVRRLSLVVGRWLGAQ